GRLDLERVGAAITLAEDGVHPFGLKLSTLSTTSSGITLTQPAGAPHDPGIEVTGTVAAGQAVILGLTLSHGPPTVLTLTATTGAAAAGQFQIGPDAAATASNIEAALEAALARLGETELVASSAFAAAQNFFNGPGEAAMRVDGPPFDSATALVAATPANT